MPHFYNADERYNLLIDGLNPTKESHSIFMDLEPTTGSPMRGGKRMQFNMFLKRINQITLTDNFRTPRLFPVLWVDEGLELNDEMTALIKGDLINVILTVNIVQWTCVGIGIALIVGMTAWYIVKRRRAGVPKTVSVDPIITEVKAWRPQQSEGNLYDVVEEENDVIKKFVRNRNAFAITSVGANNKELNYY